MTSVAARKEQLLARKEELHAKLQEIEEQLDKPAPADDEERALEREDDEVLERLGQSGLHEIQMIDAALGRVEDGTYGECAKCGEDIAEERLNLLPYTPLCRNCAA